MSPIHRSRYLRLPYALTRAFLRRFSFGYFAIILTLWCTAGCATPMSQYGNQARFSPAYRGYVLATYDGSDDPSIGEDALLLRDPLTGSKLRCHEDVVTWREAIEDTAADQVQDDNAAIVAVVTGGTFAALGSALQPIGAIGMVEGQLLAGFVYDELRSADAYQLIAAGVTLFERKRYAMALRFFERALIKDQNVGMLTKVYYYLGVVYAKQEESERAVLTLSTFVNRAGVRDVDAYREAEALLDELGESSSPDCESSKPVKVFW